MMKPSKGFLHCIQIFQAFLTMLFNSVAIIIFCATIRFVDSLRGLLYHESVYTFFKELRYTLPLETSRPKRKGVYCSLYLLYSIPS